MVRLFYKTFSYSFILLATVSSSIVYAEESIAEIQKKLNEQTFSRPFSVESEEKLNSALNAATERGKPTPIPSNPSSAIGYYGNYYQPYYGFGYGYGFNYYSRPYSYYGYRPYYSGYYW